MNSNLKHFAFYFILMSALTGCKHDPVTPLTPTIPERTKWTLHPATMGNWFITNQFYKDSNQLTVVGMDYRLFLNGAHEAVQQTSFPRLPNNEEIIKPFVGKTFFAYAEANIRYQNEYNAIKIYSVHNPLINSKINIKHFGQYHTILTYKDPACLITDDRMYLPVMDTTGRALSNAATCFLLVFKLSVGTDSIQYQLEDRLWVPNTLTPRFKEWSYASLQALRTGEIGMSLMGTGYHFNTRNKSINPLFPALYGKFGFIKDTLFAIGCEDTRNVDVLRLNYLPNGQTQWQASNIYGLPAHELRWYFLENELLAVHKSQQIYHFARGADNKIYLDPLDCQSIEGIQDITYFKGRVYIASLQGLYYKSWKDFWTYL